MEKPSNHLSCLTETLYFGEKSINYCAFATIQGRSSSFLQISDNAFHFNRLHLTIDVPSFVDAVESEAASFGSLFGGCRQAVGGTIHKYRGL